MNVDFIRIAGRSVRVTSLKENQSTGSLTLVVIARGSVDRRQLSELLASGPVLVEVPDRSPQRMGVTAVDERVVGAGERAITRFSIELTPVSATPEREDITAPDDPLAARLDRIESSLQEILAILRRP